MDYTFNWQQGDLAFVVIIGWVSIGFISYYFLSKSTKLRSVFLKRLGEESTLVHWVVFERLMGIFLFGLVPILLSVYLLEKDLSETGVNFSALAPSLYWILGLLPVIVIMNYLNASKSDNLEMYPQIRKKHWNIQLLILSAISWIVYLMAYEFMFRGFLLFNSVIVLGVWPAIALNIGIYALVHVPKGIKEAVGAIPLGLLLCIISLQTESILVAVVVHIALALTNEWFSLKAHPQIVLK